MECRVVLVGVGIDLGAQALSIEVDLLAVACTRAFECHVLDEMADAVASQALMLAATAHEDTDRRRGQVRLPENDHAHAVV